MALPPGQHRVDGFPRFGTHLHRPPPAIGVAPEIEVRGAVAAPFTLPVDELATMPRVERTADFHCVAGWSATGLRWAGVAFAHFYRSVIEPSGRPDPSVTHVVFRGLDGYRSVILLEDALADDVLIADSLDGRPLDPDHGAPVRLVSPSQYGYVSIKHLCVVELHTSPPRGIHTTAAMRVLQPHPRARVWQEERHRRIPGWSLRPGYRLLEVPIRLLSARGSVKRSRE